MALTLSAFVPLRRSIDKEVAERREDAGKDIQLCRMPGNWRVPRITSQAADNPLPPRAPPNQRRPNQKEPRREHEPARTNC